MNQNYLTNIEVASKVLMCFDGTNQLPFRMRTELILLNFVNRFENELKLNLICISKFSKSDHPWHFRKIIFGLFWDGAFKKFTTKVLSDSDQIDKKDLEKLKSIWENEYNYFVKLKKNNISGHRLWNYLSWVMNRVFNQL